MQTTISNGVRYFKAWICFFLLATLIGAGAGMLIGMFAGGIMGGMGVDLQYIRYTGMVLGYLISIPVSFVCFRWAVEKFILPQIAPVVSTPMSS